MFGSRIVALTAVSDVRTRPCGRTRPSVGQPPPRPHRRRRPAPDGSPTARLTEGFRQPRGITALACQDGDATGVAVHYGAPNGVFRDLHYQQDELQAEAEAVHEHLGLGKVSGLGEPVRVGSAALGLMVRRDLDLPVICPALDEKTSDGVARIGAELLQHPRVRQVNMRDDTGHWRKWLLY
jgi:hypothetical protein